mmetsp:Transcript_13196/g.43090  ORF Transcript_13196/g.43090 Transcript_13196/m.43090 type:complete len:266 (+) Transcript_13196:480-1277(+)
MSGVFEPGPPSCAASLSAESDASAAVSPAAAAAAAAVAGDGGGRFACSDGSRSGEASRKEPKRSAASCARFETTSSAPLVSPPSLSRLPVSSRAVAAPAARPKLTSFEGESPTMQTSSIEPTRHSSPMCSSAAGSGLDGHAASREIAGESGALRHRLLWKWATVASLFRVTSADCTPCASSHAASSAAPGISASVRRPSASISSTTRHAVSSARQRVARISSPRGTPARRYISPKSKLGTVSVPSMSKTTPRRSGLVSAIVARAR